MGKSKKEEISNNKKVMDLLKSYMHSKGHTFSKVEGPPPEMIARHIGAGREKRKRSPDTDERDETAMDLADESDDETAMDSDFDWTWPKVYGKEEDHYGTEPPAKRAKTPGEEEAQRIVFKRVEDAMETDQSPSSVIDMLPSDLSAEVLEYVMDTQGWKGASALFEASSSYFRLSKDPTFVSNYLRRRGFHEGAPLLMNSMCDPNKLGKMLLNRVITWFVKAHNGHRERGDEESDMTMIQLMIASKKWFTYCLDQKFKLDVSAGLYAESYKNGNFIIVPPNSLKYDSYFAFMGVDLAAKIRNFIPFVIKEVLGSPDYKRKVFANCVEAVSGTSRSLFNEVCLKAYEQAKADISKRDVKEWFKDDEVVNREGKPPLSERGKLAMLAGEMWDKMVDTRRFSSDYEVSNSATPSKGGKESTLLVYMTTEGLREEGEDAAEEYIKLKTIFNSIKRKYEPVEDEEGVVKYAVYKSMAPVGSSNWMWAAVYYCIQWLIHKSMLKVLRSFDGYYKALPNQQAMLDQFSVAVGDRWMCKAFKEDHTVNLRVEKELIGESFKGHPSACGGGKYMEKIVCATHPDLAWLTIPVKINYHHATYQGNSDNYIWAGDMDAIPEVLAHHTVPHSSKSPEATTNVICERLIASDGTALFLFGKGEDIPDYNRKVSITTSGFSGTFSPLFEAFLYVADSKKRRHAIGIKKDGSDVPKPEITENVYHVRHKRVIPRYVDDTEYNRWYLRTLGTKHRYNYVIDEGSEQPRGNSHYDIDINGPSNGELPSLKPGEPDEPGTSLRFAKELGKTNMFGFLQFRFSCSYQTKATREFKRAFIDLKLRDTTLPVGTDTTPWPYLVFGTASMGLSPMSMINRLSIDGSMGVMDMDFNSNEYESKIGAWYSAATQYYTLHLKNKVKMSGVTIINLRVKLDEMEQVSLFQGLALYIKKEALEHANHHKKGSACFWCAAGNGKKYDTSAEDCVASRMKELEFAHCSAHHVPRSTIQKLTLLTPTMEETDTTEAGSENVMITRMDPYIMGKGTSPLGAGCSREHVWNPYNTIDLPTEPDDYSRCLGGYYFSLRHTYVDLDPDLLFGYADWSKRLKEGTIKDAVKERDSLSDAHTTQSWKYKAASKLGNDMDPPTTVKVGDSCRYYAHEFLEFVGRTLNDLIAHPNLGSRNKHSLVFVTVYSSAPPGMTMKKYMELTAKAMVEVILKYMDYSNTTLLSILEGTKTALDRLSIQVALNMRDEDDTPYHELLAANMACFIDWEHGYHALLKDPRYMPRVHARDELFSRHLKEKQDPKYQNNSDAIVKNRLFEAQYEYNYLMTIGGRKLTQEEKDDLKEIKEEEDLFQVAHGEEVLSIVDYLGRLGMCSWEPVKLFAQEDENDQLGIF